MQKILSDEIVVLSIANMYRPMICILCGIQSVKLPSYQFLNCSCQEYLMVVWRSGSALVSRNEVNLRRVRLVLGWVTMSGFISRCGTFISICNQPPRPTQPGHPFIIRWQVKLCDPLVTHGPYLSAFEV